MKLNLNWRRDLARALLSVAVAGGLAAVIGATTASWWAATATFNLALLPFLVYLGTRRA